MPKVSVVVPIYNTERYLNKCLDSILGQTLNDIEIICINDGSTDHSLDIIREYAEKDDRIVIINKENGGSVSSRNAGIAAAAGKYIGFVDSDDYIEQDMYRELYFAIESNKADLVTSGFIHEGGYISIDYDSIEPGVYSGDRMEMLRNRAIMDFKKKDKGLSGSLCTKLFLASKLQQLYLDIPETLSFSEDKLTLLRFLLECEAAVVLHDAFYHYMINVGTITTKSNTDYLVKVHEVCKFFNSLYSHKKFTWEMRTCAELYVVQLLIKGINTRMGFQNRNLLWIDPYWKQSIPEGSRILIYGAGDLGRKYHQQIMADEKFHYVGCIDFGFADKKDSILDICSPYSVRDVDYDILLITIKNPEVASSVKELLIKIGIDAKKIRWFDQPEIFWRFAEADGLLQD